MVSPLYSLFYIILDFRTFFNNILKKDAKKGLVIYANPRLVRKTVKN